MLVSRLYQNITAPGGGATSFNIMLPIGRIGLLSRLVVAQTDGDLDGFTAELLNAAAAAPPNKTVDPVRYAVPAAEDLPAESTLPIELFYIIPALTAAGAADQAAYFEASGMPFRLLDIESREPQQWGILKITPATAMTGKVFAVAYTLESAS